MFWGQFKGKKATYAASMGTDHSYSNAEYAELKGYLKNFDFLSTREDSLRNEMAPLTDKQIQTVVDPTLLISRKDYENIAIKPQEENYVLIIKWNIILSLKILLLILQSNSIVK